MTGDLETRLRDAYAALDPGAPPAALRERVGVARAPVSVRRWRAPLQVPRLAAALGVAVLVACGGLLLAGSLLPAPPLTAPPSRSTSPQPTATHGPTAQPSGLPPGARVVDGAWNIAELDWSPDGAHLAVLRSDQTAGQGLVDILDPHGNLSTGFKATTAGWLDASHIVTFWAAQDGTAGGSVTVHALDGTPDIDIPGTWAGILPNGHGTLVLPIPNGVDPPDAFRVWTAGTLGPAITGHGDPMRWSPDGHLLALESGITYGGGTGASITADLQVLQFPGPVPLRVPGDTRLDGHTPLLFSADSGSLVATTAVDASPGVYSPTLYDLHADTTRPIAVPGYGLSWTPDGRLVVQAEDGAVRLWSPVDGSVTAGPAGLLAYGPDVGDVVTSATQVNGSPTTIEVTATTGSLTLATTGASPSATWTPDGSAIFVATGGSGYIGSLEPLVWLPAPGLSGARSTPTPSPTTATSLPSGAMIVDEAPTFETLDWSPGGRYLAAVSDFSGALGIDVLDATGRRVAMYSASEFGWLDGTHLVTFQLLPNDPGPGTGAVVVHAVGGGADLAIPGQWDGAIANGHGSIVLIDGVEGAYQNDRFQVWQDGHLGPAISGHGTPFAVSADGRLLALETTGQTARASGFMLANTGGPLPASVQVLDIPGGAPLLLPGDRLVDNRSALLFSPDDRWLADDGADEQGPVVYDLAGGATRRVPLVGRPIAWTPDGRLVIDHFDGTARLWSPDGTLTNPDLPGLPVYGPAMSDLAIVPGLADTAGVIIVRTATGSRTVASGAWGESAAVTWSPDGGSVYLTIAGDVRSLPNDLLVRVPAP